MLCYREQKAYTADNLHFIFTLEGIRYSHITVLSFLLLLCGSSIVELRIHTSFFFSGERSYKGTF